MTKAMHLALLGGIAPASFQIHLQECSFFVFRLESLKSHFVAQGSPHSDRQGLDVVSRGLGRDSAHLPYRGAYATPSTLLQLA